MSAGHTPTPWVIRTLDNFGFNIVHYVDGDKFDIARVAKTGGEENAALIVLAVNAHDDLVEALRPFVRALEDWCDEPTHPDRLNIWEHPIAMNVTVGDFRRANAALSKALGNDGGEG